MKNTAVKHRAGTLATPDFAMLMAYKNEDVLYKFQDAWRVDREEAEDIFTEMKKIPICRVSRSARVLQYGY